MDEEFSIEEVKAAVKQSSNNKSPGEDGLINEIFKRNDSLHEPCRLLFNRVLKSGQYPKCWSTGVIIPLHKKGDVSDAKNYKGITLLPVLSKLFTRAVNNRLGKWADENGKYSITQAGFRKEHGTQDHIFSLHAIIEQAIKNRGRLYTCMLDFSAAFDTVVHDNVWFKMATAGVTGQLLKVMRSMYSNIKSRVRGFNGLLSQPFLCKTGVRQGESLSPFLFAMLLNDFEEYIKSNASFRCHKWNTLVTLLFAFADDCSIIANSRADLQEAVNLAKSYCDLWGLKINTKKTKVMEFTNCRNRTPLNIKLGDETLEEVDSFCYLGVTLFRNGRWTQSIDKLVDQGRKAMYAMKSLQRRHYQNPIDKIRDFEVLVEPVITYTCSVWGSHEADAVTGMYNAYHKRVLGLRKQTPTYMWLLELGLVPIRAKTDYRMVAFWATLLTPTIVSPRLAAKVYLEMLTADSVWCRKIKDILERNGLGYYWHTQQINSRQSFLNEAKRAIYGNAIEKLKADARESSKGELYKDLMVKADYRCHQWYLTNIDRRNVTTIAKIRTRNHRLYNEVGDWYGVDQELRNCPSCNVREDEAHVVMSCPEYREERERYILPEYKETGTHRENLIKLLESKDRRALDNLAIFWRLAMDKHADNYCAYLREIL